MTQNGNDQFVPYRCTRCRAKMGVTADIEDEIECIVCHKGKMKRHKPADKQAAETAPQSTQAPASAQAPEGKANGKKRFRTLSKPKKEYPPGTLMGACRYCGEEYPKKGGLTAHETGHKNRGDKPLLKPVEGKPAVGIIEEPRQRVKKDEREVREHNEQYQRL